jgi:hypothetical protein
MKNKGSFLRKLKVDKRFTASEVLTDEELFRNGIFVFNISQLIKFIESNPSVIKKVTMSVKDIPDYSSDLDESHLKNANIDKPIIFGEIAPGRYNLIDGYHRVEKARRLGVKELWASKIDIEYLQPFFISEEAYKTHINYWNSKLE